MFNPPEFRPSRKKRGTVSLTRVPLNIEVTYFFQDFVQAVVCRRNSDVRCHPIQIKQTWLERPDVQPSCPLAHTGRQTELECSRLGSCSSVCLPMSMCSWLDFSCGTCSIITSSRLELHSDFPWNYQLWELCHKLLLVLTETWIDISYRVLWIAIYDTWPTLFFFSLINDRTYLLQLTTLRMQKHLVST